MIPNLNFYDIYGYLLPGLTLLSLIWLPFGLMTPELPSEKLSSALIAIVAAYITGHLLQMLSKNTLSSEVKDRFGRRRTPSDRILDADDTTFLTPFKQELAERIQDTFNVDVEVNLRLEDFGKPELGNVSARRNAAFFLCRSTLVQGKVGLYGEQYEGMYTLMRGLTAAFGFGSIYHLGWASSGFEENAAKAGALFSMLVYVATIGALVVSHKLGSAKSRRGLLTALSFLLLIYLATAFGAEVQTWRWSVVAFWTLTAAFASMLLPEKPPEFKQVLAWLKVLPVVMATVFLGSGLGSQNPAALPSPGVFLLIASAEIFIAVYCYRSYKHFALEFPRAIYRDFAVAAVVKIEKPKDQRDVN